MSTTYRSRKNIQFFDTANVSWDSFVLKSVECPILISSDDCEYNNTDDSTRT
jgi:hypothetical protein